MPVKQFSDELALTDEELYVKMKEVEADIEFLNLQEDFIREEHKNLKKELLRAKEEIKRIQAVPLVIGQFIEMVDMEHGEGISKQRPGDLEFWFYVLRASAEHIGQRETKDQLIGGSSQTVPRGG